MNYFHPAAMSGETPMEVSSVPETIAEGMFYIHDIRQTTPGASWPEHIKESIMRFGGNDPRQMTLDEVGAVLLHVAMLETGFVPDFANVIPQDEQELLQNRMGLIRRCVMGLQMPQRDRNVMQLKYSSVQLETNPSGGLHRRFAPTTSIDVLMTYWNGRVYVSAKLPEPVTGFWNSGFSYTMDLRRYINPIQGLELSSTTLLNPEAWLNIIRLDGLKFASVVKRGFCIPLLDSIDGYLYDARITDLPDEVLQDLLKYFSDRQLRQVRIVSKGFRVNADIVLKRRNQPRVRITVSSQF